MSVFVLLVSTLIVSVWHGSPMAAKQSIASGNYGGPVQSNYGGPVQSNYGGPVQSHYGGPVQ